MKNCARPLLLVVVVISKKRRLFLIVCHLDGCQTSDIYFQTLVKLLRLYKSVSSAFTISIVQYFNSCIFLYSFSQTFYLLYRILGQGDANN